MSEIKLAICISNFVIGCMFVYVFIKIEEIRFEQKKLNEMIYWLKRNKIE